MRHSSFGPLLLALVCCASCAASADGGSQGAGATSPPSSPEASDGIDASDDASAPEAAASDASTDVHVEAGPPSVLPGGKPYYVFAAVRLNGGNGDFVKIGQVTFSASEAGKHDPGSYRVTWRGWFWSNVGAGQPGYSGAVGIGTKVGADCNQTGKVRSSPDGSLFNTGTDKEPAAVGELRAASSYTGAPTEVKSGDYALAAGYLHIRWDDGATEDWNVTAAPAGIQKLEPRASSAGFTGGVAAGSNTPFSTRIHPSQLTAHARLGFLPLPSMTACTQATWVINQSSYRDANSPCSCNPKRSYLNNWVARIGTNDRRDLWHSWCECLAVNNAWYDGGSHQRMMLQALDDAGHFRGYVGVEADTDFAHADLYNYLDF